MVNGEFTDAERMIAIGYAPPAARAGLMALLALDDTLGAILRTTREPMVGQMRLTWWHGALESLDDRPPPAEPVLEALARHVVPVVPGRVLARQVEGWEELLDLEPLDDLRLRAFATGRGAAMFEAGGRLLGAADGDPLAAAGRGWALADLAAHVGDAATARRARALADADLAAALSTPWSRNARALGALAHRAARPERSPPAQAARMLWHRLTGR